VSADYDKYKAKIKDIALDSTTCQIVRNNSANGAIVTSDLKIGDLFSTPTSATPLASLPSLVLSDSSARRITPSSTGVDLAVMLARSGGNMIFYVTGSTTVTPVDFDIELVMVWRITAGVL
jgi:hypothetical protein